jgi:hypothetical protein
MALVVAILWISQKLPPGAQSCGDETRVPYRAQDCGQSAKLAVRISPSEAVANAISMPYLIHSARPEIGRVNVLVVVTPTGTVASATPFTRHEQWYQKAEARAMTWRFVPFRRQGSAIYATFSFVVRIVPPEKRPEQHISFPEINDWNSLRITLSRSCPVPGYLPYKLTVFGDGRVLYGYFAKEYRGHVSAEAVRQLVNLFRIADYFNLYDRYVPEVVNVNTLLFTTSISFDNESKSVVDFAGLDVGMPEVVRTVEDGIELLAGPKVWHERQRRTPKTWGLTVGDYVAPFPL